MVKSFAGPSLGHPMLLGLFAVDILTRDAMTAVREKGEQLWQAQKVTVSYLMQHLFTSLKTSGLQQLPAPEQQAARHD
jgi:hypothetical protein